MRHTFKRGLACLIAVLMLVGIIPFASSAADIDSATTALANASENYGDAGLTVITDEESSLAPGISMNEIVVYDKNGDRVEMFIATADTTVDTVKIQANYKDNQNDVYGMQKTTEQVAAAEANYEEPYTVVAAINASYYNTVTGKPTGTFVMRGNDVTTESEGNAYAFFALLKDGTYMIGAKGEYSSYKGQIEEAVGGYIHLVKDGAIVAGLDKVKKYPRQTLGLTADGKIILMTADGSQAPKSIGLTVQEQAEVMLAMGCVEAIHLDGGGSATFCAKPEGSDEFKVLNSPCDGSERSVSNSLMFISTAVADGTFDHATVTAQDAYVTPNATVAISATGVDAAGGPAEIPEGAVLQVADETLGSIVDGAFVSSGKAGKAVIQMVYDNAVVGETTINVVIPDGLAFEQTEMTVPYGKTVDLGIIATYGVNEVKLLPGDVTFEISDDKAGSFDGFSIVAPSEDSGITSAVVTAYCTANEAVTASTSITFGKGSVVLYDFEDGSNGGWVPFQSANYNYIYPENEITVVSADEGQVRNGDKALKMALNYSNSYESGYMLTSLGRTDELVLENARSIGMWMYVPEETDCIRMRLCWYDKAGTRSTADFSPIGALTTYDRPGWYYFKADLTNYPYARFINTNSVLEFYVNDRDGVAYDYYFKDQMSVNTSFVFYIDDITVDYSTAIDDREAPVFGDITYADSTMSDAAVLNGQTVSSSVVSFSVAVEEDKTSNNYVGLDADSIKAYIDGNEVTSSYANGRVNITDARLTDGLHKIRFVASDNLGNTSYANGTITINSGEDAPTVKVVAHDTTLDRILLGSIYYVDIVATEADKTESVTVDLDLNNMSVWNLDHMNVTYGFEAEYSINEDDNTATITITRTGDAEVTGEAVLASMPIRTWEWGYTTHVYGGNKGKTVSYKQMIYTNKEFWPIDISVDIDRGALTLTDGTVAPFSGATVQVDTEMWANYANMVSTTAGKAYYDAWGSAHEHRPEYVATYGGTTPVALPDKPATCTEDGYTGRTFCEECNSVVEWGETLKATGHTFAIGTDGILDCDGCGKKYTGEFEGKDYVDGVVSNGWKGESYYVDGAKLTGVNKVMAPDNSGEYYYDFGENGICKNQAKYTGLFKDEAAGVNRYAQFGVLSASWKMVGDDWYYFNHSTYAAVTGEYNYYGIIYNFDDEGRLLHGTWVKDDNGTRYYRYKNTYYYFTFAEIDGKTYYFDKNGYMVTGYANVANSQIGGTYKWHLFADDGEHVQLCDGVMNVDGTYKYFEDGFLVAKSLVEVDGDIYYIRTGGVAATGKYYVGKWSSDELAAKYPEGYYYFDQTGKMINRGIINLGADNYYIENNVPTAAGLVEVDGEYYFARTTGVLAKGKYYVTKYSDPALAELFPTAKYYYFDETGKLVRNAIYTTEDGTIIYLGADGQPMAAGLIEVDGKIYYAKTNGIVVTGDYYVGKWSTDELKNQFPENNFMFRADGSMIYNCTHNIDGTDYYVNPQGQIVSAGLVEIDGEYYYARTNGVIAKGKYYVGKWSTDELKNIFAANYYYFDETGKMIRNNFITDENGAKRYVNFIGGIHGAGLVQVDGEYYYARTDGYVATGKYYVGKWSNAELSSKFYAQYYYFDETGKMLRNTFITDSNGDKRYLNSVGSIAGVGLIELDGNVYYIRTNGYIATGNYYVGKWSNSDLEAKYPAGKYNFDADGKMIIG